MDERYAPWVAAEIVLHVTLEDQFHDDGIRFAAFANNADPQLVRAQLAGRRSIMTRASADSGADLLKIPADGFYELLLAGRMEGEIMGCRRWPCL